VRAAVLPLWADPHRQQAVPAGAQGQHERAGRGAGQVLGNLREKSRVRIEHPDLPQQLQGAAGEMVSALWQQAQAAAQDSLVQLRDEARAAVVAAEGLAQSASARADAAEAALGTARDELRAAGAS
jgi:hypothetical protein